MLVKQCLFSSSVTIVLLQKKDAHFLMEAVLFSLCDELTTWCFVIKKNCGQYIRMVVGLRIAIHWTCTGVEMGNNSVSIF